MTTLADVAAAAGVSTATISHVINGTRYVSPQTAERVQRAIDETRYRPNPYARALRTATTESIGFVASDITNPYSTAVMRGITAALRDARYTTLVANSDEDPGLETDAIDALVQRRADGLIIALTTQTPEASLNRFEELGVPLVLIDRAVSRPVDQVLVEDVESVRELVGSMLDAGHRRVAIIAGRSHHSTSIERIAGWRAAHELRGLPVDEGLMAADVADESQAQQRVTELIASSNPPTAIFSTSNVLSLGALRALKEAGKQIPSDISFAAFDDLEWTELLDHPITCLAQPTFEIGTRAVELLLRRISDPGAEHTTLRLPPELKSRRSITPPKVVERR